MENYYALLNVKAAASEEEIKTALREQRKKCRFQTNSPNLERRQEAEKAMRLLDEAEQVLLDDGKRRSYDQQLAQAGRAAPPPRATGGDLDAILREAYALEREGQVEAALDLAREAARVAPGEARVWRLVGVCYEDLGERQKAATAFTSAIRLDPKDAELHVLLAQQLEALGNYRQAIEAVERAASLEPGELSYRVAIGQLLIKMGNTVEGLDVLEKLAASDPANSSLQWALASGYVDVAYLGWTSVGEDHPRLDPGQYATSYEQVQFAQEMVGKAMALKFDDPKMIEELESIKKNIESNLKRRFVGNWILPLVVGGLGALNITSGGAPIFLIAVTYVVADFVPEYIINRELVQDKEFNEFGWIHDRFFAGDSSLAKIGIGYALMLLTFMFFAFYNLYRYQGDTIRRLVKRAAGSDTLASMVAKVQKGSQQIRDTAVSQVGAAVSHAKEQMAARKATSASESVAPALEGEASVAPLPTAVPEPAAGPKQEIHQPALPSGGGSAGAKQPASVVPAAAGEAAPVVVRTSAAEGSASGAIPKARSEVAPQTAAAGLNNAAQPFRAVTAAVGAAARTDAGKQAVDRAKAAAKKLVIGKLVTLGGGALVLGGVVVWGLSAMRSTGNSPPTVDVPMQVAVAPKTVPAPVVPAPAPVPTPAAPAVPAMEAPPAQPMTPTPAVSAPSAPAPTLPAEQPAAAPTAAKPEAAPQVAAPGAKPAQAQPRNDVRVAAVPASPPAPKPAPAAPRDAAGDPTTARLVSSNLAEGSACLQSRKFECAVARADMVLQLDPGNQAASSLRQRALAEQRKAFESSELK